MKLYNSLTNHNLVLGIKSGQIGVIPTDTIYGLVGSALDRHVVERVYAVRKRDRDKPLTVLIPSMYDLTRFGVVLSEEQRAFMYRNWPGEVSVILPVTKDFDYLSCGTGGIAFRLPKDYKKLRKLLTQVGPIVAPSANPQSEPPAADIDEAMSYFGDTIDFYVDGGRISGAASTLVDYTGEVPKILRQGAADIK